jgi:hypothetical protein
LRRIGSGTSSRDIGKGCLWPVPVFHLVQIAEQASDYHIKAGRKHRSYGSGDQLKHRSEQRQGNERRSAKRQCHKRQRECNQRYLQRAFEHRVNPPIKEIFTMRKRPLSSNCCPILTLPRESEAEPAARCWPGFAILIADARVQAMPVLDQISRPPILIDAVDQRQPNISGIDSIEAIQNIEVPIA